MKLLTAFLASLALCSSVNAQYYVPDLGSSREHIQEYWITPNAEERLSMDYGLLKLEFVSGTPTKKFYDFNSLLLQGVHEYYFKNNIVNRIRTTLSDNPDRSLSVAHSTYADRYGPAQVYVESGTTKYSWNIEHLHRRFTIFKAKSTWFPRECFVTEYELLDLISEVDSTK